MKRDFLTSDVLRLEVEDLPAYPNLIVNPDGELGGWGWLTILPTTIVRRGTGPTVLFVNNGNVRDPLKGSYFESESFSVAPGQYVRMVLNAPTSTGGIRFAVAVVWLDESGVELSSHYFATEQTTPVNLTAQPAALAPAGAALARLRLECWGAGFTPTAGAHSLGITSVMVAKAATSAELTGLTYAPPVWTNILGSAHSIRINREPLQVGVLSATIIDSALDPSLANALLQPGTRCRAMARTYLEGHPAGEWLPIFTGKIDDAKVSYNLFSRDVTKRSRITLEAHDAAVTMGQTSRPDGVATVDELKVTVEGCGTPWNINSSTSHTFLPATVVSRNDKATALDQVGVTRDTALAQAWIDRAGVLQVWDIANLDLAPGNAGGVTALDEDDYHDLDLAFDPQGCINYVMVTVLSIDPVTGEGVEETYGPYKDQASIDRGDVYAKTFTVHGMTTLSEIETYANAILAASSEPRWRAQSASLPISRRRLTPLALIDLCDKLTVSNTLADYSEDLRVGSIEHTITTRAWDVLVNFNAPDGVASPAIVPSPGGPGGKTLAQLLRPVGEVTMWYGAAVEVPAGWLICDGSGFDTGLYPELAALLGSSSVPNMTDRMPIGAGVKALNTSGGSPTTTMPGHSHTATGLTTSAAGAHDHGTGTMNSQSNTSTGGTATRLTGGRVASDGSHSHNVTGTTGGISGTNPDINTMPPWRALWFIIRAA